LVDLFTLSRQYCVTICGFLVPINLLLTSVTLLLLVRQFPTMNLRLNASLGIASACGMIFHVATWLVIGVVMTPTYVLFSLGVTCLCINSYAIFAPHKFRQLLGIA